MNEFKFKQKEVVKDEDLLKFKNFNEVLTKHNQISRSYKSIAKVWGSIGLAALIGVVAFLNYNPTPLSVAESNPIVTQSKENIIVQSASFHAPLQEPEAVSQRIKPIKEPIKTKLKQDNNTPEVIDEIDANEKTNDQVEHSDSNNDSLILARTSTPSPEERYHLKYKTIEERVNLPTLYIGGKAWPTMIKKSDLVKKSNPTAFYKEINQEVPVISYVMSKIDKANPEKDSKKIHNQDGRFSAAILREVHRSNPGDFLIYKNVVVYIPGIGRMDLGDLKVEIVDDKLYQQRLREKKPLTD